MKNLGALTAHWIIWRTGIYRVPFEQKIQKERQHQLDEALKTVRKKHESYEIPVSAARLAVYGKKRIWEK